LHHPSQPREQRRTAAVERNLSKNFSITLPFELVDFRHHRKQPSTHLLCGFVRLSESCNFCATFSPKTYFFYSSNCLSSSLQSAAHIFSDTAFFLRQAGIIFQKHTIDFLNKTSWTSCRFRYC